SEEWQSSDNLQEIVNELVNEPSWKTNLRALVAMYSSVILWIGAWNIITNCYNYFPTLWKRGEGKESGRYVVLEYEVVQNVLYSVIGIMMVWNSGTLYQNAGIRANGHIRATIEMKGEGSQSTPAATSPVTVVVVQTSMVDDDDNNDDDNDNDNNNELEKEINKEDQDKNQPSKKGAKRYSKTGQKRENRRRRRREEIRLSENARTITKMTTPTKEKEKVKARMKKSCWKYYELRFWFLTG
ncbi:RNA-binding region RNP-1 domain-containing protein, partial [Reticulomyxa filosa]